MPNRLARRSAAARARRVRASRQVPAGRISAVALSVAITGADSPSAEKPARFEMVAYTGEAMRISPWDNPVIVDLETADLGEQRIPALYDHWADLGSVVGQVEELAIENRHLVARGFFTVPPADPERGASCAERVLALARAKYQWQASVGADPSEVVRIEAGAVGVANWGREYPGPCVIGRGCKFRELSFVVLGGDRRTSVVTASNLGAAMTFEQWLLAMGFDDASALTEVQRANMELLYADEHPEGDTEGTTTTEPVAASDGNPPAEEEEEAVAGAAQRPAVRGGGRTNPARRPADPVRLMNQRIAANQQRIDSINRLAAAYTTETGAPTMEVGGRQVSIAVHAITAGWDASRTELALMRATRPNPSALRGGTGSPDADRLLGATVEAALLLTAGFKQDRVAALTASADRERVMNDAGSGRFKGYSLHALMDETIRAAGHSSFHGNRKSNEFIRAYFAADRAIRASQGFTTLSLTNALANVANKAMLASYEAVAVAWKMIAAVRSHSDFKAVSRFRLDSTGAFRKVGPDGELKHIGLTDTAYSNQLATFGAIIALTRQMQINDDLGAFLEIPKMLGRMSAVRIDEAVFVLLLSSPSSFFSVGNKNLLTGTPGSTFSVDGLEAAETSFSNQVDGNGKPILTTPDRVLVPTTLKTDATIMWKNTTLTTNGDSNIYSAENPYAGKYMPVVSPYLNNTAIKDQDGAAISGQSSTAWYMFADPAVRAAIAVAFLNGQETPTIEDAETDFATLGRQWRAFHDFGVGMEDPTAANKNTGA
jgi:hypothetical protein